jgi:multidrug efflux pump subunit AcrA (membrane-fusion protein)
MTGVVGKVKPGMFATGTVATGTIKNVLLVPKDAVSDGSGIESVFLIQHDNSVKKLTVKVIRSDRNNSQIEETNTLKAGDRLVTQGLKNVQDGSKVELDAKEKSDVAH